MLYAFMLGAVLGLTAGVVTTLLVVILLAGDDWPNTDPQDWFTKNGG